MNTIVQQQQVSQAIIPALSRSTPSCTPVVPGFPWHMHRSDFEKICGHPISADALRAFEQQTNARITELRHSYDIPDNQLPCKDDLWIEASAPDVQFWTLDIWDQSTYSFCLREHSESTRGKSLLELGFLRRRFVAYPGRYMLESLETTIYLDRLGNPFVIVDDDSGNFIDDLGEAQNAKDAGYTVIRRQYLYMINEINAALAKLIGQSPPAPMERWKSLQRVQKKGTASETTTKSTTASNAQNASSQQTSAAQGVPWSENDNPQGVQTGSTLLFENKNNTDSHELSLNFNEKLQRFVALHNNSAIATAPWTPETCVALSAQINHELFALPAQIDEETYNRDWRDAAQRLIEKRCADFAEPSRAWERIELHIWAMLIGHTWYANERTNMTPFSLRHVESNWKTVEAELRKHSWPNYVHIDYTGPSIFDEQSVHSSSAQTEQSYAQGYGAQDSAQPTHVDEQSTQSDAQALLNDDEHCVEVTAQVEECTEQRTDDQVSTVSSEQSVSGEDGAQGEQCTEALEVIAQPEQPEQPTQCEEPTQYFTGTELALQIIDGDEQGMTSLVAARLRTLIRKDYPDILIANQKIDGYCLVAMQIALDTWYYLGSLDDWNRQSPETQEAVIAAEAYAQQRNAAQGNDTYEDSQGPPGEAWVSEEGGEWR